MASLDELRKIAANNTSTQTPADKLAAMRPDKPLPGRIVTHSDHSSDTYVGRPITESDHSLGGANNSDDE